MELATFAPHLSEKKLEYLLIAASHGMQCLRKSKHVHSDHQAHERCLPDSCFYRASLESLGVLEVFQMIEVKLLEQTCTDVR